ncbi:MAG: 3'-5' exonuclease, partial [Candidatus Hodarchaeota archaeon]
QPFRYNEREQIPIFILDYETHSQWEHAYESYPQYEDREYTKSKLVNGIQIYFLNEDHQKRKAFLRHEPYFFLLLEDGLSQNEINQIIIQIREIGDQQVVNVEKGDYYDAADLTFLVKNPFLKVTADRPGSVPNLRTKTEELTGVKEWREADVLFHHRCAIDHDVRVGAWYLAEINRGEILNLSPLTDRTPPPLKILAFDIETDFEQTRDPNPNKDQISMISMFNGKENKLIINSGIVDTKKLKKKLYMLLRQKDDAHTKPWVDWVFSESTQEFTDVIENFLIDLIIVPNEKELIQLFYRAIDQYRPDVLTDFFGGRFDIPFLALRSEKHIISFEKETGFEIKFRQTRNISRKDLHKYYSSANIDHVAGAGIIHLDAYLFNEKYSYLPKKDLGLKPSVEKKLKIIPLGRELLLNIKKDPISAIAYAGCDGYITWKYVREIVLDFFISMGQIFPVTASELLTRRAGSLDDLLIDAEDHKHQIIGRRRIGQNGIVSFSPSIVIESLAYTGGLVEAKRPGIWRSDLYYDYQVNRKALGDLKLTIKRVITKESNKIAKEVIKEEFEKRLLAEMGEVKVEYSEDPVQFLKQVEIELLRNGTPHQELTRQLNSIRDILEEISGYQPINVSKVVEDVLTRIDRLSSLNGKTQLKGVHVDVTSMYPSQIRQYKLQPSGIVSTTKCRVCELAEADNSCFFEGDWVIKLSANRPCRFKDSGLNKCSSSICKAQDEAKCKRYEPIQNGMTRSREIFTFDGRKTEAYILKDSSRLEKVPINHTYFGSSIEKDPFVVLQQWLRNSVEATQLTTKLNLNHFDIFEDTLENIQLPDNTFLSLDVRTKKITILLSVQSRVCQKAYNFVARIMDDFFNTRVRHKIEAKRLSQIISQKYQNQPVPAKLLRQQKFHESTQIGMKVPLNSIYGLLGMKGGVRNASMPCAGITTKLSADLIYWAANELEKIVGLVVELDTDGIWLWVPKLFPLEFPVTIENSNIKNGSKIYEVSLIDKILNDKVATISRNDNYWINNGDIENIHRSSKSLIQFEQDGPYDFQFMMGKKKYIVYNYSEGKWIEKELTGLESKRADFSKLQKYFQETIINTFLENFNPENPITLTQLYENANRQAYRIRSEMIDGRMDPSFFVKPKAINKPLRAYKSKLPQVSAAYILKDLGYSIDPGTRIQMLNIKGNHVIPHQLFDFEFKKIKEVLVKHAIATLSFMLGELSSKEDLMKLIDVKQYIEDIFGPGRIYDRMIKYPKAAQQLTDTRNIELDLSEIPTTEVQTQKLVEEKQRNMEIEEKIEKPSVQTKQRIRKKIKGTRKLAHQSLDSIFLDKPKEIILSPKSDKQTKVETIRKEPELDLRLEEPKKKIPIITEEELEELETNDIFANGNDLLEDAPNEELIVCSECGALVNPREITREGCTFCGGQLLIQ